MLQSHLTNIQPEAGCDEAGRGCLAGPVFASAVILPHDFFHPLLNDSKQLTEQERDELRPVIEHEAVAYAVGRVEAGVIDRINILKASILAMHHALDQLSRRPKMIIVDGNRFSRYKGIPHQCIVKGDAKFASIAAASVLAKTYRDEWMKKLHEEFPGYNWKQNKGYPTEEHRRCIGLHGVTPYHRLSFRMETESVQVKVC